MVPRGHSQQQQQQVFMVVFSLLRAGILHATSGHCPRADVAYSICTLARRLSKTKNWIVGLASSCSIVHEFIHDDPLIHSLTHIVISFVLVPF